MHKLFRTHPVCTDISLITHQLVAKKSEIGMPLSSEKTRFECKSITLVVQILQCSSCSYHSFCSNYFKATLVSLI
jgi:hypothetical protein